MATKDPVRTHRPLPADTHNVSHQTYYLPIKLQIVKLRTPFMDENPNDFMCIKCEHRSSSLFLGTHTIWTFSTPFVLYIFKHKSCSIPTQLLPSAFTTRERPHMSPCSLLSSLFDLPAALCAVCVWSRRGQAKWRETVKNVFAGIIIIIYARK